MLGAFERANPNAFTFQSSAFSLIFTDTARRTLEEKGVLGQIGLFLFPRGPQNQNERNDALIVFSAWKHRCTLITNDGDSRNQPGGILGHRGELADLGITVISDNEAVAWVKEKIRKRDHNAVLMHEDFAAPLPGWVGED